MVPDKFNMVDMGDIDLIEIQGLAVEGLYQKLVESIALCRYQCLYNWKFNGILIPPSYVEMELREGEVWINEGVSVDEEDVVHISSIEPEPPIPPTPVEPVIESLSVIANGIYTVPSGVDGFNPVTVNVPTGSSIVESNRKPTIEDGSIGDYWLATLPAEFDSIAIEATVVARGNNQSFNYYGTSAFRLILEDGEDNQVNVTDLNNASLIIKSGSLSSTYTINATAALTASVTGAYFERNGLPAYFVVSADDIGNYKPVSIGLCRRQGTAYIDYLVDFSVILVKNNVEVATIKTVSDLTESDWPNGEIVMFSDFSEPLERKLFYKEESGWIQIL